MDIKKKIHPPVKAKDFYSLVFAEDPRIHPHDEIAAYVKVTPENQGKKYSRVIHLLEYGRKSDRQITSGPKGVDYMPRWAPDGKNLAFISTRSGKAQVYLLPEKWGEPMALTSAKNGVHMFEWSPDNKNILFLAMTREEERVEEDKSPKKKKKLDVREAKRAEEDKEYAEKMRIDPRVYHRTVIKQGMVLRDDRNSHLYIQAVSGGPARRLTDGERDFGPFSWSADCKTIFTSTSDRADDPDVDIRSDIVKIDVKSGEMTYLTDSTDSDFSPRISPDGKWLYCMSFLNTNRFQQKIRILRIPVEGGKSEDILGDYDLDPGMFQFDENGKYLYFTVGYQGRDSIARIAADGGEPEYVVRDDGMVTGFHLVKSSLIYGYESPDTPSEIRMKKLSQVLASGKTRQLTKLNNKFLKKRSLSLPEEVWLDRPDGFKIQGWYMLPHGYEEGKKYPWIVQVHGGPHVMWGYSWWHEFQSMCARGYGVYFSNPRGSDGYGHEFKGAIHKKWGEEDSRDILAGIDRMVELGLADPNKLFLTGGSFGGFMTGWLVTHDTRFKAAVAQRGVYNFVSMYGASDALTLIEWEFDTLPWKNTELLWDRSPLKYVENVTTPTMIIHSEQDYRVGISQAEEFYIALKRCGKKAC
ncbi:S9 family peptidase, partial [bacterium]|nr:S9 family peptidase [bacterium]